MKSGFYRRAVKRLGRLAIDASLAGAMMLAAFWLRVGFETAEEFWSGLTYSVIYALICLAVFASTRLSFRSWRTASAHDFTLVFRDVSLTIVLHLGLSFLATRLFDYPRSVPLIAWSLINIALCSLRLGYRFWHEEAFRLPRFGKSPDAPNLLLAYGANAATETLIRALAHSDRATEVIGIIDDNPEYRDRRILGHRVLGTLSDLPGIMERLAANDTAVVNLVVPSRGLSRTSMKHVFDAASAVGLRVVRIPDHAELVDARPGKMTFEPIKVSDILGREPADLLLGDIRDLIAAKTVLVTGGGGSIGSEICRQVCARGPARLLVIDHSEFNLFSIQAELEKSWPEIAFTFCLASVRDKPRLNAIFAAQPVNIVFHAAAYKHVPIVEHNPLEGILTNVFGTKNVADAAQKFGISAMVVISTDKAVRPKSVMGLTKRVAEAYCQSLDLTSRTRFVTVRFGNVLGSSGSVVPIFEQQIRNGGPVTITHRDMTRYFMTIPEASQLVLQATVLALKTASIRAGIMVLDMGQPVRIVDLATRMIALAGLVPGKDIQLQFTGLRPGEKLFEELFEADEDTQETDLPGVLLSRSRLVEPARLHAVLDIVEKLAAAGRVDDTLAALWSLNAQEEERMAG